MALSSHCGLAVAVFERVVFLADQLVRLLVLLDDRVAQLGVLVLQLAAGKMLHDAGAKRVAQHVGGGTQAVPWWMRQEKRLFYTRCGNHIGIRSFKRCLMTGLPII